MKLLTLVAATVLALAVHATPAVAQTDHGMLKNSPKTELTISYPLAVGDTVLKPGTYTSQCRVLRGGQTFLVVTMADTGREVARTPCVRESSGAPISNSSFWTSAGGNGVRTLTRVGIQGETVTHRLVNVN